MISVDEMYLSRCIELALLGEGNVAPNPLVGAVLVHQDKIIGEGYHQKFGGPHAEVNAIDDAIQNGNEHLLTQSTLYVNLEPCTHFGKTPPCCDLIIRKKIPRVVIGSIDPFREVNGSGIRKLRDNQIDVTDGILNDMCNWLNRRFFLFHEKKRPFVVLKFAQTSDRIMATFDGQRKKISSHSSDILVHKWRSEETAIMVGTRTAEVDDPLLTVRQWIGSNPLRITIDRTLQLKRSLKLFQDTGRVIVFNEKEDRIDGHVELVRIDFDQKLPVQILNSLFRRNVLSMMIEGGPFLLNQFVNDGLWDEARIITSNAFWKEGISSPNISGKRISLSTVTGDSIEILKNIFDD